MTTEEDVDGDEAMAINEQLNAKMMGAENAGSIAFVNRSLKFSPWKMSNVDAQFIESRAFSVQEIARMFGLPINLLSVQGAVSNWGTGVSEANLGLQKYVLMAYTSRIESGLGAILPPGALRGVRLPRAVAGLAQGRDRATDRPGQRGPAHERRGPPDHEPSTAAGRAARAGGAAGLPTARGT